MTISISLTPGDLRAMFKDATQYSALVNALPAIMADKRLAPMVTRTRFVKITDHFLRSGDFKSIIKIYDQDNEENDFRSRLDDGTAKEAKRLLQADDIDGFLKLRGELRDIDVSLKDRVERILIDDMCGSRFTPIPNYRCGGFAKKLIGIKDELDLMAWIKGENIKQTSLWLLQEQNGLGLFMQMFEALKEQPILADSARNAFQWYMNTRFNNSKTGLVAKIEQVMAAVQNHPGLRQIARSSLETSIKEIVVSANTQTLEKLLTVIDTYPELQNDAYFDAIAARIAGQRAKAPINKPLVDTLGVLERHPALTPRL